MVPSGSPSCDHTEPFQSQTRPVFPNVIAAAESLESLHDSLLESLEGELGELDDELKEAMSFFDVAKSGKWKLADILGADAEIDED